MKSKYKFVFLLLIGIFCGFWNLGLAAQVDIQKIWCDGIVANTYVRNVSDCRLWIRCNGPDRPPSSGFCPVWSCNDAPPKLQLIVLFVLIQHQLLMKESIVLVIDLFVALMVYLQN